MFDTISTDDLQTATGGLDNPRSCNWHQHKVPIRKRPVRPAPANIVDDDLCDGFCGPQG